MTTMLTHHEYQLIADCPNQTYRQSPKIQDSQNRRNNREISQTIWKKRCTFIEFSANKLFSIQKMIYVNSISHTLTE